MKIMHLADFHLDSAFSGLELSRAEEKRAQLRECFVCALARAKEEGIKLVLIAGDLFDTPFCSFETRKKVFDAISGVGCPVVIAPGNHDYYNKNGTYADKNIPENAFVFTSNELGRFDFDELGVSVVGYAFTSDRYEENPLAQDVPLSSENVNILCAHAELGAPFSKYAPLSPNAIARCGFAYAALGHVHNAPEPVTAGETLIAYSGFPQGRSFDELGEGGAYILDVDLETRRVKAERIILSKMVYAIERVDVTGASSEDEIAQMVRDAVSSRTERKEDLALRVRLCGSVPSELSIDVQKMALEAPYRSLALLQIRDETVANFDLEHLKKDMTVRGEIYRKLLPMLESADDSERRKASLALKFALAALDKREFGID